MYFIVGKVICFMTRFHRQEIDNFFWGWSIIYSSALFMSEIEAAEILVALFGNFCDSDDIDAKCNVEILLALSTPNFIHDNFALISLSELLSRPFAFTVRSSRVPKKIARSRATYTTSFVLVHESPRNMLKA